MKIKTFTLIADATASIVGAVASYFFFHPLMPMVSSELVLASISIVSALFTFYVFRKNVAPMTERREIPRKEILFPFYLFEIVTVIGLTFFALIGTFFGFLIWKYILVSIFLQ
jgi:hypothetical protein